MSCLYILEINPLSVASFANIFSHSEGCLFILFMVSFAMQKLLSLIRSYLFIFVLIFITVEDGSKKKKNLASILARCCKTLRRKHIDDRQTHEKISTLFIIREMQIKAKMSYQLTPIRMVIIKKSTNSKCWRACGEKGTLLNYWWKCKLV